MFRSGPFVCSILRGRVFAPEHQAQADAQASRRKARSPAAPAALCSRRPARRPAQTAKSPQSNARPCAAQRRRAAARRSPAPRCRCAGCRCTSCWQTGTRALCGTPAPAWRTQTTPARWRPGRSCRAESRRRTAARSRPAARAAASAAAPRWPYTRISSAARHAGRKGRYGRQVMQQARPVGRKQRLAHKHDVAGLRVGEHAAAPQVGVGVLQPAGHR